MTSRRAGTGRDAQPRLLAAPLQRIVRGPQQVVTINSTPMTIVGVAPRGFAGIAATRSPDLFVPLMMKAQLTPTWNDLDNRGAAGSASWVA